MLEETKGLLKEVMPSELSEMTPEMVFGAGEDPGPCPMRMEEDVITEKWLDDIELGAMSS